MLNIQNIQRTHTTQHQKISNLIKKWVEDLNMFPKKTYRWPWIHEKMFNITNHQGSPHQRHNDLSPHNCQNGYYQKYKKQQVLVRM